MIIKLFFKFVENRFNVSLKGKIPFLEEESKISFKEKIFIGPDLLYKKKKDFNIFNSIF